MSRASKSCGGGTIEILKWPELENVRESCIAHQKHLSAVITTPTLNHQTSSIIMWQLSEESKVLHNSSFRRTIANRTQERVARIIDVSRIAIH